MITMRVPTTLSSDLRSLFHCPVAQIEDFLLRAINVYALEEGKLPTTPTFQKQLP